MHIIGSKYYYSLVLLYLVLTSIVGIFSINFFDQIRSFTNKSDSMNPLINTGSIVMVRKLSAYQAGDVISYYVQNEGKEEIVTHRIIREGGNVYVTKGDANQVNDREVVRPRLVIGKAILIIPYLGYYISFAKGPVGLFYLIILPAILIVTVELYKIFFELNPPSRNSPIVRSRDVELFSASADFSSDEAHKQIPRSLGRRSRELQ